MFEAIDERCCGCGAETKALTYHRQPGVAMRGYCAACEQRMADEAKASTERGNAMMRSEFALLAGREWSRDADGPLFRAWDTMRRRAA